ncbi:hypothetical protein OB920_17595 [Halobacteria archaeon HArc-gm2]|nr:hypothetical protein [Halobacteria archaeon HArc-gm2]
MERRKFVLSLGALAGGGAAVGTGAFSSVGASRDVTIDVAGDASAYLGIKPHSGPNGQYADTTSSDALALDFSGSNSNIGNGIAGGEGVNANALTTFANVFTVENQGTQDIDLEVTPLAFIETDGAPFPTSLLLVLIVPAAFSITLSPGQSQDYHVVALSLESDGEPDVSLQDEMRITAEEA